MAFRVEISAQAERDAAAILEWLLSQHTGQAGIDWFLSLDNAFASLAASVARSKPAMCGHFKTGHRTNVRDRDFYSYIRA